MKICNEWYNKKEGIWDACDSLGNVIGLIEKRREHFRGKKEGKLSDFYALHGRLSLDSCGNASHVRETNISKNRVPLVVTRDEFGLLSSDDGGEVRASSYINSFLPKSDITCPYCGDGWTIETFEDFIGKNNDFTYSLDVFKGGEVSEAIDYLHKKTDGLYRLHIQELDGKKTVTIQNDLYVDNSRLHPDATDGYESRQVVNRNGVISVDPDYVVQDGDNLLGWVHRYYHGGCLKQKLAQDERISFSNAFVQAGFERIESRGIPNEYCGCEQCAPWFKFDTEIGTIKIGWRKRVASIDWKFVKNSRAFLPLFEAENVTKWADGIHAHGMKDVERYLRKIREACI
jgi:hypothetical protein